MEVGRNKLIKSLVEIGWKVGRDIKEGVGSVAVETGKPILIFYANLLRHGITMSVVDGGLRVGGATGSLSPAYRDEISRRAEQLTALLSHPVPDELASYHGRLLNVSDTVPVLGTAEQIDADVRLTPVDGGWLMTMGNGSQRPSTRSAARKTARTKNKSTRS